MCINLKSSKFKVNNLVSLLFVSLLFINPVSLFCSPLLMGVMGFYLGNGYVC